MLFKGVILTAITISPIQCHSKEPTKAQKRFNTLTKGLKLDKALLQKWLETHDKLKMEVSQSLIPVSQEIEAMKLKMLVLLDKCYGNKALTVRQKEKLHSFIQYLADTCLSFDDSGVAEEIHDRYNDMTVAEMNQEAEASFKSELEDLFGVDLGDDFDFSSESSYADFLGAINDKKEQASSTKKQSSKKKQTPPKVKKKSDNEILENQSIKEVFRQLTKVLHPDREMDEIKKLQKSELMQRANLAYEKNDLLALLELQFEIEQFEQQKLDNLANEKLLAYNRMLQRQRKQLKEEIALLKQRISHEMKIPPFYDTPDDAFFFLHKEKMNLDMVKAQLEADLDSFSDIKSLKQWLNAIKKSQLPREQNMIDELMSDIFDF